LFGDLQAETFRAVQAEIDARLIPLSGTALAKIEAIGERLPVGDAKSVGHAMSTVRRVVTAQGTGVFRECPISV
jgi:hypothetical protein